MRKTFDYLGSFGQVEVGLETLRPFLAIKLCVCARTCTCSCVHT
jgi:hypothetical protein